MNLGRRRAGSPISSTIQPPPAEPSPSADPLPLDVDDVPSYANCRERLQSMQRELDELEDAIELAMEKRISVAAEAEALAAGRSVDTSPASSINVPESQRRVNVLEQAIRLLTHQLQEQEHRRACQEIRRVHLAEQERVLAAVGAVLPPLTAALIDLYRFNQKFDRIDHPPAFRIFDAWNQEALSRLIQQLQAWPEPLETHSDDWRPPTLEEK